MSSGQPEYPFFEEMRWRVLGLLGSLILRLLFITIRTREVGRENRERGRGMGHGPLVHTLWHSRLLGHVWFNRNESVCVMNSLHRDSELVVRVVLRLGFHSVRGSSTRGAIRGLLAMLRAMRQGHDLALTVDGPRGPAGEVKPGAIYAASRSGCPIVPSALAYSRQWRIGSWDRFRIPKPFSRMVVVYGEPLSVPKDLSEQDVKTWSRTVKEAIDRVALQADNLVRPLERPAGAGLLSRLAGGFLTRCRDRWYHLPLLILLLPLEFLWRAAWFVRELLYGAGILRSESPPVPSVCVGGLSAGGSGKTPAAMLVAGLLKGMGLRVAVLSRGYGRDRPTGGGCRLIGPGCETPENARLPRLAGDEAALLLRRLPGVHLAVGADRRLTAREAVRKLGAEVLVLDDGFGHRQFGRSMDLLTFNPGTLQLTGHTLPAGYLREPRAAVARARALIVAGDENLPPPEMPFRWGRGKPVVRLRRRVSGLIPLAEWPGCREPLDPSRILAGKPVLAACGIANPEGFRDLLATFGPSSLQTLAFPDHHSWPGKSLSLVKERTNASGALLVVTEKDAVKLDPASMGCECLVLRLDLEDCSGGLLDNLLRELTAGTDWESREQG